jgi:hypothetical protein
LPTACAGTRAKLLLCVNELTLEQEFSDSSKRMLRLVHLSVAVRDNEDDSSGCKRWFSLDDCSVSWEWWNLKRVAEVVFGLRFMGPLGLLHEHLTADTTLFNENGTILIVHVHVTCLAKQDWNCRENVNLGGFSGEDWTQTEDIHGRAEIASGISDKQKLTKPGCSDSVSEFNENRLSVDSRTRESFWHIFNPVEESGLNGLNSDKNPIVLNWITSSERATKSTKCSTIVFIRSFEMMMLRPCKVLKVDQY